MNSWRLKPTCKSMGLFDIFKINKKRNSEPENIDEIFALAASDVSYRPLFYRTILDTDLYLLTFQNEEGKNETGVKVKNLDNGKVPIFTSIEKIFENNIIIEEVNHIVVRGKSIFENCPDDITIVLNPYSIPTKEFTPLEIRKLVNGELFKPDQTRQARMESNILISQPKVDPISLAESIRKYCVTRREIRGAYLALMEDTSSEELPHLIVGLEINGNIKEIFGELTEVIRPNIPNGEPIDMIDISGNSKISKQLKKYQYKVY